MRIFLLSVTSLLFTFAMSAQCENGRYLNLVFDEVSETENISYGANTQWDGTAADLLLDVYQPVGDTETARPLVIFAHGGSFVGGSKDGEDVIYLAEDFAKMGFVTASINYRLGTPTTTELEIPMKQAVIRGYHDMKAAIRWFRKNAAEDGNTYAIDPDKIFIAGVSAGGFITTHVAYMDEIEEIPAEIDQTLEGLGGGLDGESGNAGYSSEVLGVINIAGALGETDWIQAGDEPILSFHGTGDNTVPYGEAMLQIFGLIDIDIVFGSSAIHERAEEVGLTNCFETHWLQGHVPHVSNALFYDTTRSIMSNFLGHFVCPDVALDCEYRELTVDITEELASDMSLNFFPNPSNDEINITNPFQGRSSLEVIAMNGQLIKTVVLENESTNVDVSDLASGLYLLRLTNGKAVLRNKLEVQ
ncbi:MAG: T9SS type A sorting domain-containing protein [Flavobacteriales bacterium]